MPKDPKTPEQYWATETDHKNLLDELDKKIRDYYDDLRNTNLLAVYERAYRAYYGGRVSNSLGTNPLFESSRLLPGGKQGEKTKLKVNHYRNLVRHLFQLSTQQKGDVQARATNNDYASEAQTVLAEGLIDYYWREKNVGSIIRDTVEQGIAVYGDMFVHGAWDPNKGEIVAVDNQGQPIYEGDQEYQVLSPMNVIRNVSLKDPRKEEWRILKLQENRWNLVAKYTGSGLEEDILDAAAFDPQDTIIPVFQLRGGKETKDPDILDLFILYHNKSDALPQGRMVIFLRDLILFDGPLPYENMPIYRYCAENISDTIYGYTLAWDLLALQEGIDELHTALMSNNKTFAQQSIWIKDTDQLQTSQLSGGGRLLKSEEMPQPVQLTKSAPESYQYLQTLQSSQELLSGVSATIRGNPEQNLKSGNALALIVSQSVQFAGSIDEAVNKLIEDTGMGLIENLRDFSKTERVANIVGESNRAYLETYNAEQDLSAINRVICEQVNPVAKTISGRLEIANNLLAQGLIKSGPEYIMVLETGRLDDMTSGPRNQMLRIKSENEQMRKGQQVPVLLTDNHQLDITEHAALLDSPDARRNPQMVRLVTEHIQEHIQLAQQLQIQNPALALILGQQPLPMPMVPPPPSNPQAQGNSAGEAAGNQKPVTMPKPPANAPESTKEAAATIQPPPGVNPQAS